ncbi:hypothetical protein FQN49_004721 [Arthroderma sp. PD_2]|nr:hypothetical protein FQN49_004721 [Arthroderma sp. PD_2]
MKFTIPATLGLMVSLSSAAAIQGTVSLSYDPKFDDSNLSLTQVACSDGTNGLITKGFTTFGSLPNFPNIGGSFAVEGYNSANCGKCFKVTWPVLNKSIFVTSIDKADGFNIAKAGMDALTNNQAGHLGRIDVTFEEAQPSDCGFTN